VTSICCQVWIITETENYGPQTTSSPEGETVRPDLKYLQTDISSGQTCDVWPSTVICMLTNVLFLTYE